MTTMSLRSSGDGLSREEDLDEQDDNDDDTSTPRQWSR